MGALDLPEQSREIGGLTYRVQPLTVRKSLQVMTRVLRMAGPGFGDVAALEDAADKMGALIGAASVLSGELDEAVLLFLCESFAEVSKVDLAPANAYGPTVGKRAWVLGLAKLERSSESTVLT